jgi:hypothetical protein
VSFRILYCKPVSYKHGPEKPRENNAKKNAVNLTKEKVKNAFVHGGLPFFLFPLFLFALFPFLFFLNQPIFTSAFSLVLL